MKGTEDIILLDSDQIDILFDICDLNSYWYKINYKDNKKEIPKFNILVELNYMKLIRMLNTKYDFDYSDKNITSALIDLKQKAIDVIFNK